MNTMKPDLYDISWKVDEETYRADPALSYSTLAKFDREGFDKLNSLFERVDTPALTFGSAVDSIITGGREEFESRFFVASFPHIKESILLITDKLFDKYSSSYRTLDGIPGNDIIDLTEELKFQLNWKPETRVKVIREQGSEYYSIKYAAGDKVVIDDTTYNQIESTVEVLKNSPNTEWYFRPNNPFDDSIQRFYQLKFKETFEGVDYRIMADLIVVDHNDKTIQPIDLKTSGKPEWQFFKSFIQWSYSIQARLYYRTIKANIEKHEEFKDYKLLPYKFIVVNKQSLTPLVWDYADTDKYGTLYYGKQREIECLDPFELGEKLSRYLKGNYKVPLGISIEDSNNITDWLND